VQKFAKQKNNLKTGTRFHKQSQTFMKQDAIRY